MAERLLLPEVWIRRWILYQKQKKVSVQSMQTPNLGNGAYDHASVSLAVKDMVSCNILRCL